MPPQTEYAKSGDIAIAYQVVGEGEMDLVVAFPFVSHLDLVWESPALTHFVERLESFARVILFDRRGVGLSDPLPMPATLEERMDDLRAVMDAAGSERAALLGASEGGTMCMLFAATYPERVSALVLCGAMARSTWAEDYPWAPEREAAEEALEELLAPGWGQGASIDIFAPSIADDPQAREFQARYERQAASPIRVQQYFEMFLDLDVRDVLPLIQAPTLVMHRRHDLAVNVRAGRYLAEQIPGSRFIELEGSDHAPWAGPDSEQALDEIEEFLTGVRPAPKTERVLATVMFTDIVDSTSLATEIGRQPVARRSRAASGSGSSQPRAVRGTRDQDDRRRVPGDVRRTDPRRRVRGGDRQRGSLARNRGQGRDAYRRGRADGRGRRRDRGPCRGADRGAGGGQERAGLADRPRPGDRLRDRVRPVRPPLAEGGGGRVGDLHGHRDAALLGRGVLSARGRAWLGHREQAQEARRLTPAAVDPHRAAVERGVELDLAGE